MNIKSRIHIYPSKDIKDAAVIAGEPAALRALARTLQTAAASPTGFDSVNLYHGNGHDFEVMVTTAVNENEWQDMPKDPKEISTIKLYNELKESLNKNKVT